MAGGLNSGKVGVILLVIVITLQIFALSGVQNKDKECPAPPVCPPPPRCPAVSESVQKAANEPVSVRADSHPRPVAVVPSATKSAAAAVVVPQPAAGQLSPGNKGLQSWTSLMIQAQMKLRPEESVFGWWKHDVDLAATFPDAAPGFKSYRKIGLEEVADKAKDHRFDLPYALFLEPIRGFDLKIRMLEVGLGCLYSNEGASVRLMGRFMPHTSLTTIEAHTGCRNAHAKHGRSAPKEWKFYLADGTSKTTARKVMADANGEKFDFIIEDGSHGMQHQIDSFHAWWPTLKIGGVYVCEDLHTSFMPNFGANLTRRDGKTGVNFFKYLQDRVFVHPPGPDDQGNAWGRGWHHTKFPAEPIGAVQCWWSICFVHKYLDDELNIEDPWKYSGSD